MKRVNTIFDWSQISKRRNAPMVLWSAASFQILLLFTLDEWQSRKGLALKHEKRVDIDVLCSFSRNYTINNISNSTYEIFVTRLTIDNMSIKINDGSARHIFSIHMNKKSLCMLQHHICIVRSRNLFNANWKFVNGCAAKWFSLAKIKWNK